MTPENLKLEKNRSETTFNQTNSDADLDTESDKEHCSRKSNCVDNGKMAHAHVRNVILGRITRVISGDPTLVRRWT